MHVPKPTIYSRLCVPVFLCIFFITAGYLFRPDANLRDSLRKMLQEFLIYGFITTVLYALLTGTPLSWNPLIGALLQVPTHARYPESILWFLPCFMVSKLIFFVIYRHSEGNDRLLCWTGLLASGIGIAYIACVRRCLPWHIQTALAMQLFWLLGYLLRKYEKQAACWESFILPVSALAYFASVFLLPMDADLCTLMFTNFPYYCVQALLGTVFLVFFTRRMCASLSGFRYIGRYSMFYYAFEGIARMLSALYVMPLLSDLSLYAASLANACACVVMLTCVNGIRTDMTAFFQRQFGGK